MRDAPDEGAGSNQQQQSHDLAIERIRKSQRAADRGQRHRADQERPEDRPVKVSLSMEPHWPMAATRMLRLRAVGLITTGETPTNAIAARYPDVPPCPTDE